MALSGGEIAGIVIGSILGFILLIILLIFLLRWYIRGPSHGSANPKQLPGKVVVITGVYFYRSIFFIEPRFTELQFTGYFV